MLCKRRILVQLRTVLHSGNNFKKIPNRLIGVGG
jgi:hypothetical protein